MSGIVSCVSPDDRDVAKTRKARRQGVPVQFQAFEGRVALFGNDIAGVPVHALHSGLHDNERARVWLAAARGQASP